MASRLASLRGFPHNTLQCKPSTLHSFSKHSIRLDTLKNRPFRSDAGPERPPVWRRRVIRLLKFTVLPVFFTSAGVFIGTALATAPILVSATSAVAAPRGAEYLAKFKTTDEVVISINNFFTNQPLVKSLRASPKWTESRPHLEYPELFKKYSLTAGTLLGPGRMVSPPLVFTSDKQLVSFTYLGPDLCGHPGVVHGGFLATMFDEGLARCAFTSLPNHIGMTASLTVNYRSPTPAGSYVILRAETTKVEGRKAWVRGTLERLGEEGQPAVLLAEAEGLFIEPRDAEHLPRIFRV